MHKDFCFYAVTRKKVFDACISVVFCQRGFSIFLERQEKFYGLCQKRGRKKFFDFDENYNWEVFEVTYYEFARKIWKFKMADKNVKIYLIKMKISTRRLSWSLIMNPFQISKFKMADYNLKIDLIKIKISTRRFSR